MRRELLSPRQMAKCDALSVAAGTPGTALMARAGQAVADAARTMLPAGGRVVVLAGPGNNGGDGYVAARLLAASACKVRVFALGDPGRLGGDARWAFESWDGATQPSSALGTSLLEEADLIIDALFGAGLARALDGEAARLVDSASQAATPVLAVDLPSGLDGATGKAPGPVMRADRTITFHALKPGHVLLPGREVCGDVAVADIGILDSAIDEAGFTARLTGPYCANQHDLSPCSHKYARGHALVIAGAPTKAGAAFLAASAALRVGAGLVTLGAPEETLAGSIGAYPALMRQACQTPTKLATLLADARLRVCALGPGLPPTEATRQMVYAALASSARLVLDAGALSAFAGMSDQLFELIIAREAPVVLTPHEGEFTRLFGAPGKTSKIERTQAAASRCGAVVLFKGADTVIAAPDGSPETTFVNANGPPWLATAGSGDVLTGIVAGLLAHPDLTSENVAHTTAWGAWLHGAAGQQAGPAMIASDMEQALHKVFQSLLPSNFKALQAH